MTLMTRLRCVRWGTALNTHWMCFQDCDILLRTGWNESDNILKNNIHIRSVIWKEQLLRLWPFMKFYHMKSTQTMYWTRHSVVMCHSQLIKHPIQLSLINTFQFYHTYHKYTQVTWLLMTVNERSLTSVIAGK